MSVCLAKKRENVPLKRANTHLSFELTCTARRAMRENHQNRHISNLFRYDTYCKKRSLQNTAAALPSIC